MSHEPVHPGLEGVRLRAWTTFLRAHASVIGELEREMQEQQGLPLTWYDILVNLASAPGCRLRMQALADSILLSRSGLTRLLDRMADAGLVRREPCPEDRRGTYAAITEPGRETLRRATPGHLAGVQRHFLGRLDDEDLAALILALDKVVRGEQAATPVGAEA